MICTLNQTKKKTVLGLFSKKVDLKYGIVYKLIPLRIVKTTIRVQNTKTRNFSSGKFLSDAFCRNYSPLKWKIENFQMRFHFKGKASKKKFFLDNLKYYEQAPFNTSTSLIFGNNFTFGVHFIYL